MESAVGYIRDDKTGKFEWVDEAQEDGAAIEAPSFDLPDGLGTAAPSAGIPRAWLMWGAVVVFVAGLGVWMATRPKEPTESIAHILAQAASMDGREVVMKGRAGEVFSVGGGAAYYLHQGGDSIVVFTRGARPLEHQNVTVHGSISIGYLDGAARPALFESQ